MTQAFNLSQFANKVNTSGQLDVSTGLTGTISTSNLPTIPINKGGTNNASLAVTAGGVVYTDGSALQNVGVGTSGYYLQSNGSSAPTWTAVSAGGYTLLSQIQPTSGTSATISGLTLTTYKLLFITFEGVIAGNSGGTASLRIGKQSASAQQKIDASLNNANGFTFVNLTTGYTFNTSNQNETSGFGGNTQITTTTTAIVFDFDSGTNFYSGSGKIFIWGVK
jgi:hypothetical protein